MFSCKIWEIVKTFFTEHLWKTASETTTKFSGLKSISSIEDDCSFTVVISLFEVFLYNCKGKLSSFIVKMFIEIGFEEVQASKAFFNLFVFGF